MMRALKSPTPCQLCRRRLRLLGLLLAAWSATVALVTAGYVVSGWFAEGKGFPRLPPFFCAWLFVWPLVVALGFRFPLERSRLCLSVPVHLLACVLTVVICGSLGRWSMALRPSLGSLERLHPPRAPTGAELDTWREEQVVGFAAPATEGQENWEKEDPHLRAVTFSSKVISPGPPGDSPFDIGVIFDAVVYLGTVSFCHAIAYFRRSQQRGRRALELEALLAQAKLHALRLQLNPHFLFNTLNTISTLVHTNPWAADNMIGDLGELLRGSLHTTSELVVPLSRELDLLQRYLDIEQACWGSHLRIEQDIDLAALDAFVPTLILQPLVENAIRHGIAPQIAPGVVTIRARSDGGVLRLSVSDDGNGPARASAESEEKTERHGIGLSNSRARLRELYGNKQTFTVTASESGAWTVSMEIPFRLQPATPMTSTVTAA